LVYIDDDYLLLVSEVFVGNTNFSEFWQKSLSTFKDSNLLA